MKLNGRKRQELTKETILSLVKDYDIYRYYFGEFKMNQVHVNHLRGEKTPSLIIGNKFGEITHKDLGSLHWRGNCFNLVEQIYNCNFNEALRIIDKDLNLGISYNKIDNKKVITWEQPKNTIIKPPPIIQFTSRKPNKKELDYWKDYHIGEEMLKKENVFFPKNIYRNKILLPKTELLTFIYFYPEINKIKIYRPHAPKYSIKIEERKFDTNVPFDFCNGLKNIQSCKFSYLTKSHKDYLVLKNTLEIDCIAHTQAEDVACVSDDTINHLSNNSEFPVIIFDNDKKGVETSQFLTSKYNWKYCNVPKELNKEGITDFADWVKKEGKQVIIEHFKNKKLL